MIFVFGQNAAHAQTQMINREYRIKAAYLFNFGRYTQWPEKSWANDQSPFVIGVLGQNPFGSALDQIAAHKQLKGRKITIHYFKEFDEYETCHILYIDKRVPAETQKAVIRKLAKSPVLLIGEQYPFLEEGGMVTFFFEENNVPFGVNIVAMNLADLKLSSKVLKLAAVVKKEEADK